MERIAEEVGCTYQNVQYHLAKPAIREELKRRTEGALEAAQERYRQALPALVDKEIAIALGDEAAENPQVKALQNALERAGMSPTKKTEVSGTLTTQTPDAAALAAEVAALHERERELLAKIGDVG